MFYEASGGAKGDAAAAAFLIPRLHSTHKYSRPIMIFARMLKGPCQSILETRNPSEFRACLVDFAQSQGFERFSAMAVVDHSLTHSDFYTTDNAPDGFRDTFNDKKIAVQDPVMQYTKGSSLPLLWSQHTYVQEGKGELWEHQASFGYHSGIALAIHFPGGRHFGIGLDSDRPLPKRARQINRLVADLQLFAVHAQDAAFQIFVPPPSALEQNLLTARELEALRWTMGGYSAIELGEALNISTRTAVFHLQNATKKLGCTSKHQAVLKALRMGLFS